MNCTYHSGLASVPDLCETRLKFVRRYHRLKPRHARHTLECKHFIGLMGFVIAYSGQRDRSFWSIVTDFRAVPESVVTMGQNTHYVSHFS